MVGVARCLCCVVPQVCRGVVLNVTAQQGIGIAGVFEGDNRQSNSERATMIHVCSINLGQKLAALTDGQVIPITTFLDNDNEETEPEFAVDFVAGPDQQGKWYRDEVGTFEIPGERGAPTLH